MLRTALLAAITLSVNAIGYSRHGKAPAASSDYECGYVVEFPQADWECVQTTLDKIDMNEYECWEELDFSPDASDEHAQGQERADPKSGTDGPPATPEDSSRSSIEARDSTSEAEGAAETTSTAEQAAESSEAGPSAGETPPADTAETAVAPAAGDTDPALDPLISSSNVYSVAVLLRILIVVI